MRGWVLPAAAAAFWAGIAARTAGLSRPGGVLLCTAAAAVLAATARRGPVVVPLVERVGLVEVGPRDRILRAAGFGVERSSSTGSGTIRVTAALSALVVLGLGWAAVRRPDTSSIPRLDGVVVRFEARISSDPRAFAFGWGVEARLRAIDEPRWRHDHGVWIRGRARPPPWQPGDVVRGLGRVRAVPARGSGFARHLMTRGIVVTLDVIRAERGRAGAGWPLRVANAVRRGLRRGAEASLPRREAGLFLGLSIGDVTSMDPEVEEDFRATGLGHLVAVSGSNVAMVLAPVLGLVAVLGGGGWARTLAGASAVLLFALVTRWEPSVLRASVMALLALLGVLAGRPRSTAAVLGAAVLFLLVSDPDLAHSLGFQLSVAATAGLVALAGPLSDRLRMLPRPVALAFAATAAAQVAVTPLLLLRFGVVPVATLPANLLALPLVIPALFAGILAAAVALAAPPIGAALGVLASAPLVALEAVADVTAKSGFPSITAPRDSMTVAVAAVGGSVAVTWLVRRRGRRATIAAAAASMALLLAAVVRAAPPDALTVTFFDVGQGDAALVRTPEAVNVLIDAGPDHDEVATRLAGLGVRRLDVVVASHSHADHVEGFPAVLARHRVGMLLEPACPADEPSYRAFRRAAAAEGVSITAARGGQRFRFGSLLLDVLGPDTCGLGEGPNDDSVVLRVAWGAWSVLFTGDAEVPAQQDLLDDGDDVAADVLKVPHHGGDTSLPGFLEAADAPFAVISVGDNTYGHPAPPLLAALRAAGSRVVRTDQAGEVTLSLLADGIVVRSQR